MNTDQDMSSRVFLDNLRDNMAKSFDIPYDLVDVFIFEGFLDK